VHKHFELPDWFGYLLDQGALGQKTKRGIYQKIGKEIHVLDIHSKEYRLSDAKVDDGVKDILRERDWAKKLAGFRNNQHPQAQFLWATFRDVFHYCALHLEHIADNARDLDFAVRWGSVGILAPLKSGRPQAGSEWQDGLLRTSRQAKPCPMPHCPPGRPSRIAPASTRREAPMYRRRQLSCALPTPCFPPPTFS